MSYCLLLPIKYFLAESQQLAAMLPDHDHLRFIHRSSLYQIKQFSSAQKSASQDVD